ncbi:hypothetical protein TYRP_008978 [Tyrophagus putrescentiae]|nr:hypothetical protein TYRP_008978 [Tyrophagus putrescentiae]
MFSHNNIDRAASKPFHMSYRRLLTILFILLTTINILSMVATTAHYLQRIHAKEETEKHALLTINSTKSTSKESSSSLKPQQTLVHRIHPSLPLTNRDAYAVVRFLNFTALIAGIGVRLLGLLAIGAFGKAFADDQFENSDKRESFTGCLAYTAAMIILLAAYYVGIVRLAVHDLIIHVLLLGIGTVFVGFALQPRQSYSKQTDTLPI